MDASSKRIALAFLLAVVLQGTLAFGVTAQDEKGHPSTEEQPVLFQEIGPIEDANPEQRQIRTLTIPTALIVEPKETATHIGFDEHSVCTLNLEVGYKMVVGCEWTLSYFRGAERVVLRRSNGGSLGALNGNARHVVQGLQEIADTQGSLQLIAEFSVFETDIPPQHMWMPKKGKYRVLWKGVATGLLKMK